jgi:prophage regulatory protein
MQRLIKRPIVSDLTGLPNSSLYRDIGIGLFTHPVKLSHRSVAWPLSEVQQIISARIAGKSDTEIKRLVSELEAARKVDA